MPAARAKRPPPRAQVIAHEARSPDAIERMVGELAGQLDRQAQPHRSSVTVDLVVGENRVIHNLGRVPRGATVTPTAADATFAWAMTSADERTAVLAVAGVAMDGAEVEFH